MQLNLMFKKYQKIILPAYEKADGNAWKIQLCALTGIYILEIVYFFTLLFEENWSRWIAIIWIILLVGILTWEISYGKRKDGQGYSLKIKKRNVLVYKFLSDYIDISDAEQRKNLQDLVRDTFPKHNTRFVSILSGVIIPGIGIMLNIAQAPVNILMQKLIVRQDAIVIYSCIAIFVLVLIFFYFIVGYYKSDWGKQYFFSSDRLDVLTFYELSKNQYEEYKERKRTCIQDFAENSSLENIAANIDMIMQ